MVVVHEREERDECRCREAIERTRAIPITLLLPLPPPRIADTQE